MNRGRMKPWLARVAPLAAAVLFLGLTAAPNPSPDHTAADPVQTVNLVRTGAAAHSFPAVHPLLQAGRGGVNDSTVAGLIDVDSRIPGGTSAGTGIVLRSDGLAVTNNHVVARGTDITATDLGDGHRYQVVVLDRDPAHDVAVIQLTGADDLAVAPIADSDEINVGDRVSAIGNAGGLGGRPTITTGEVTALGQSIVATDESAHQRRRLHGMIQVSATVRPGDSGGALVGDDGVIGMITATSPGAGFAIPINTVIGIARDTGRQRAVAARSE